jgi:hypothetical protein
MGDKNMSGDHNDIHSCSYYCEYPACIKRQRDEMREQLLQREWVGLTEEDLNGLARWADEHGGTFHTAYGKAIEAKLREKNFER